MSEWYSVNFAPQGWQCPICKRVYSPTTPMCYYCGNGVQGTRSSTTADDAILKKQEPILCKDCKHGPTGQYYPEFPEGSICPCQCSGDQYYSWYPEDDWFCANGEPKDGVRE